MADKTPDNEEALCRAAVRHFERRLGQAAADFSFPERDASGPPVELRCTIGKRRYAIEHTLLEPFRGSIEGDVRFYRFAGPLQEQLTGLLPRPGIYTLYLPIFPTAAHSPGREQDLLRQAIADWVTSKANEMAAEYPTAPDRNTRPFGHRDSRTDAVEGLKLTLTREMHWQYPSRHDGRFMMLRATGPSVEEARQERIDLAFKKKLPKLRACRELGDSTILLLEFSDICLTNHVLIAQAAERLNLQPFEIPDHVLIADTTTDSWDLYVWVENGEVNPHLPRLEIPFHAQGQPKFE